jgi:ribosomal protein L18
MTSYSVLLLITLFTFIRCTIARFNVWIVTVARCLACLFLQVSNFLTVSSRLFRVSVVLRHFLSPFVLDFRKSHSQCPCHAMAERQRRIFGVLLALRTNSGRKNVLIQNTLKEKEGVNMSKTKQKTSASTKERVSTPKKQAAKTARRPATAAKSKSKPKASTGLLAKTKNVITGALGTIAGGAVQGAADAAKEMVGAKPDSNGKSTRSMAKKST